MKYQEFQKVGSSGKSHDDRGSVMYVNSIYRSISTRPKRFYLIENDKVGFVRAWHGHNDNHKLAMVISGKAILAAVKIKDLQIIDSNRGLLGLGPEEVYKQILSSESPNLICIPKGYANGAMALVPNTKILYFAFDEIEEAKDDDIRFDASILRDIWNIKER